MARGLSYNDYRMAKGDNNAIERWAALMEGRSIQHIKNLDAPLQLEKYLIVGRHKPIGIPEERIAEVENIRFSEQFDLCIEQIRGLLNKAWDLDAALVLENTPGIVTAALVSLAYRGEFSRRAGRVAGRVRRVTQRVGVIVSRQPETRPETKTKTFEFPSEYVRTAAEAVKFVNERASVAEGRSSITIKVDLVIPFVFHHIEWFT